jgi:uncharacterized protein with HEPN domain
MSKIDDLTRLKHIRDASEEVVLFTHNIERKDLDKMRILSANQVSENTKEKYCQIPWRLIIGMRNHIIHAYFDVDLDIVWQVLTQDIFALRLEITRAINDLEKESKK